MLKASRSNELCESGGKFEGMPLLTLLRLVFDTAALHNRLSPTLNPNSEVED